MGTRVRTFRGAIGTADKDSEHLKNHWNLWEAVDSWETDHRRYAVDSYGEEVRLQVSTSVSSYFVTIRGRDNMRRVIDALVKAAHPYRTHV